MKNKDEQHMGENLIFHKHFNSEFWQISGNSCIDIPHVFSPVEQQRILGGRDQQCSNFLQHQDEFYPIYKTLQLAGKNSINFLASKSFCFVQEFWLCVVNKSQAKEGCSLLL